MAAARRIGAAGLVAPRLLLFGFLHRAFCVAQRIGRAVEIGFGAFARGIALLGKIRPCAAEDGDTDRRELDDAVDLLQQHAVMACDRAAALPARQQLRHRFAAVGVEIVGGLVEQQQVGRLDQQPGQRNTRALAAAERSDRSVQRQGRQAGFRQRVIDAALQRPVGLHRIVERAFAAFEPAQPGDTVGDAEGLLHVETLVGQLREHADRSGAVN